ncbi:MULTISPECIES: hypothetical protein [unclassified Pseudofrankia]|uniref:hypothetical protein n=1 Tax=unclassified Pseudofrankia TaxID=2994372 RepID=UPI0008D9EDA5|nr:MULTISPECIES: hypothetical protein [unclassified Pseudofrankia]MDT3439695.1 hypothetical protein [Pseudofrankia sp. BMG5.37]OHV44892.1 hypothetical protein BCD48_23790 [Pseudofrankia sp. BMG5.36]
MFEPPNGTAAPLATGTDGANVADTAAGTAFADTASDDASGAARDQLDQLRRRFVRGQLLPLGHLIVRYRLVVPGGFEAPWVLVTSWPAPAWLLGRCLNDTVHPDLAHIRMGRTVAVGVDDVIDWAVLDASSEIAEGGWSRGLRHAADLPDLPGHPDPLISARPPAAPANHLVTSHRLDRAQTANSPD